MLSYKRVLKHVQRYHTREYTHIQILTHIHVLRCRKKQIKKKKVKQEEKSKNVSLLDLKRAQVSAEFVF